MRRSRPLSLVLVAFGLLAGCGGGDEAEVDADGGASASSTTTTATAATTATTAPTATTATTAAAASTLKVSAAKAAVTVPAEGTQCPATVTVNGTIDVTGAGSLTYLFTRSDGKADPVQTIQVTGPGAQKVVTTLTLGTPGAAVSGWVVLDVISPQRVRSEQAPYSLTCGQAPPRTTPSGGGY